MPAAAARAFRRSRAGRWLRKLHVWIAVLFTAQFVVVVATGLLVQYREFFGLDRATVSRRWLPHAYRPLDPDTQVRADIVVTDLHSGRLFGPKGPLFVDLAVLAWIVMMATGYGMVYVSRRRSNGDGPARRRK